MLKHPYCFRLHLPRWSSKISKTAVSRQPIRRPSSRYEHLLCFLRSAWGVLLQRFVYLPLKTTALPQAALSIDALIEDGSRFEVYLNHNFSEPLVRAVQAGKRVHYVFENIDLPIRYLRIDPTNLSRTQISLCSVELKAAGNTVARLTGPELRSWAMLGVSANDGQQSRVCSLAQRATTRRSSITRWI